MRASLRVLVSNASLSPAGQGRGHCIAFTGRIHQPETMGTFHGAVLLHLFPVQENPCVQILILSSMAQGSANKTKTTDNVKVA